MLTDRSLALLWYACGIHTTIKTSQGWNAWSFTSVSIYAFIMLCMVMGINPGLLTGWTFWGSNSGGVHIVCTLETGHGGQPVGTGSFPRVKRPGRGFDNRPPPHLAPKLKKEWSYTYTPPWAFMVCSRVNFALPFPWLKIQMNTAFR